MITLNANIRTKTGKSASRNLRLIHKVPGIIYGKLQDPLTIELDHNIILNFKKRKDFYNKILFLIINGKKNKVIIKEIQYHPFKIKLNHIDFFRI